MSENIDETQNETVIKAIPASAGTVSGRAFVYHKSKISETLKKIDEDEVSLHLTLFDEAQKKTINQWAEIRESEPDNSTQNIINAQIEILRDPELTDRVKTLIKDELFSAQHAVQQTFEEYINIFSKTGSPVISGRVVDITDLRDRLIMEIEEKKGPDIEIDGDILVTEELSAREVIRLSHKNIKGIILERGGKTSHSAIIARSLSIPMTVGAENAASAIENNTKICLDASRGDIYINPSDETRERIKRLGEAPSLSEKEEKDLCRRPFKTADGQPFILRANVEFTEELTKMDQCGAQGVGLLRTEAIYLNTPEFGGRNKQQAFYDEVLKETANNPVTIRLFDIGGDKFQSQQIREHNPFLGWRGVRMLLDKRELLREQLMAILATASLHAGRVKILLPMVTTLSDIDEIKKEIEFCGQQLIDEGATAVDPPVGIMVETPAVALQAKQFAQKVDFFSIGTNDLIQYLLAVDRGNERVAHLYNQNHPVIWQLISNIVQCAHQQKIDVEVCGELASYPVSAACLLGLNVDGLSMNPAAILPVKKLLMSRTMDDMKALAKQALRCETLNEIDTLFENWKNTTND